MPFDPRDVDTIYESVRDRLKGRINTLTNFTESSFNYVWTRAYANRFRDAELVQLAVQLSGWVDYAGGPVTQNDLDQLDIENVEPEEVNQFMRDQDLDELAKLVGAKRDPGTKASGTVTFTTQSQFTEIPDGTSVGTSPDATGDFFEFVVDTDDDTDGVETPSGETETTAPVTAIEVGVDYNTGSSTVTYLPDPPTGVQSVTNTSAIDGGQDRERNDEFRERIKNAIFDKSGGGTAAGVRGFVRSEVDDVTSVAVKEYPGGNASLPSDTNSPGGPGGSSSTSPFSDVIVEGGETTLVEAAINDARPVAIQHNLVRPIFITVGVTADVEGSNIDTAQVEEALNVFLARLDLSEPVYRDKIIQQILNTQTGIDNIENLEIRVENESILYDSDNSSGDAPNHPLYKLGKGDLMETDGIKTVTGTLTGSSNEFIEGTDYDEGVVDDSSDDAIDWGLAGDSPDEETEFNVTYTIEEDITVDEYEKATPGSVTINTI